MESILARLAPGVTRRKALARAWASASAVMYVATLTCRATADDEASEVVKRLTGRTPVRSDRVHLAMPATFPNGYTVPMRLEVDSSMTASDHVREVCVFAPRNPLIKVARFRFTPGRSVARVSTRIRLAENQHVIAVADMSDGALLMTTVWVEVASNGCV